MSRCSCLPVRDRSMASGGVFRKLLWNRSGVEDRTWTGILPAACGRRNRRRQSRRCDLLFCDRKLLGCPFLGKLLFHLFPVESGSRRSIQQSALGGCHGRWSCRRCGVRRKHWILARRSIHRKCVFHQHAVEVRTRCRIFCAAGR